MGWLNHRPTTCILFHSVIRIYAYNTTVNETIWKKDMGISNANRPCSQNQIMYSICVRITMFNLENILNLNYGSFFILFMYMTVVYSGYQNKSFM